jgi:branched-chain amino acid transport system permease protein
MSMGITISLAFALSWGLSAAVAATAGILLANLTGVNFTLADLGLLVFPVVILGGGFRPSASRACTSLSPRWRRR